MSTKFTIALIEDNTLLRDELCDFLNKQGWDTHGADCGEQLNQLLTLHPVDLVVLDVNLPHEDGYSIAGRLRQSHPDIGIIMLTARTRPCDRVMGYKTGADIYLTKPTHTEELEAAIRNFACRLRPLLVRQLTLNMRKRCLITVQGQTCSLSSTEVCLLKTLTLQPEGRASADFLLATLNRELNQTLNRSNLAVIISRLRSKIAVMDSEMALLSSARKLGYQLDQSLTLV
ncbi:MAG: response regulator transcription factor [Pseudomonadota bacterium]